MGQTLTVSVHGNAFCSEQWRTLYSGGYDPNTGADVTIPYHVPDMGGIAGWGRTFGQSGWYHVAIPTPLFLNGNNFRLLEVIVLCILDRAHNEEVHLYSGDQLFWTGNNIAGDAAILVRPRGPDGQEFGCHAGLGISLRFTVPEGGYILFRAATVTFDL